METAVSEHFAPPLRSPQAVHGQTDAVGSLAGGWKITNFFSLEARLPRFRQWKKSMRPMTVASILLGFAPAGHGTGAQAAPLPPVEPQ
jgi:hypothetical protein